MKSETGIRTTLGIVGHSMRVKAWVGTRKSFIDSKNPLHSDFGDIPDAEVNP